ncbi:dephospho-CoA kinase [Marinifilum sp. N1E240]|uniref:dephospho-CoA kinase n=1 Tax=Marinifilum sp. N1E240 TaxID=2608082 RepID=UPI00128CE261|nr:dephospho-CoA kinase [Marinifilum sp. N1E240]MPQ47922.1 dephospho-CoA kinase [Marinifilum sp. N1E240]
MLKVGLTGGIGTGKSIAGKVFSLMGIPVYISDIEAKRLMNENLIIREQLIAKFGKNVYLRNKQLNRKYLADIIFNQPDALKEVNAIVHPVVREDFTKWCEANKEAPYVIQESAILFDTGLYKNFDKIICITAQEEVRISRVIKRDKVSEKSVKERIENQISEAVKVAKSDYVIYNNSELIIPQIISIDDDLKKV